MFVIGSYYLAEEVRIKRPRRRARRTAPATPDPAAAAAASPGREPAPEHERVS